MHRFFIDPQSLHGDLFHSDDEELVHQLSRVLKLRAGERIVLLDNTEHEYEVELTTIEKTQVKGNVLQKTSKPDTSNQKPVHLFVPPLKNPSRWEWMVEKCAEIGVASFTPLITERTEVKKLRKLERLNRIIQEAAEQSGRTKLPAINAPVEFHAVIARSSEGATKQSHKVNLIATLCIPRDSSARLRLGRNDKKDYQQPETSNQPTNLFLGPVGDFTPREVEQSLAAGFLPLSLGSQVLRTETAAVVAATLLVQHQ